MNDNSISNFGLLIAYVLPGLVALWGGGLLLPDLAHWTAPGASGSSTIGGFLYTTVAAVGAGLTASTLRWLLIDPLHHITGIKRPRFDFSRLDERVQAFHVLNENHYRYYQFYANSLVAGTFAFVVFRSHEVSPLGWTDLAFLVAFAVFFAASRDTLRKYYLRLENLLGDSESSVILLSV